MRELGQLDFTHVKSAGFCLKPCSSVTYSKECSDLTQFPPLHLPEIIQLTLSEFNSVKGIEQLYMPNLKVLKLNNVACTAAEKNRIAKFFGPGVSIIYTYSQ